MVKAATAERYAQTRVESIGADVGRRIRAARRERGMSLAQLGGEDLSRSFLSLVELGRSRISLRALSIVATRLDLPISHFLDDAPGVSDAMAELALDQAEAAMRRRRSDESLRILDEALLPEALRSRALWLRGCALLDLGRTHEAISVLQEALPLAERRDQPQMTTQIRYALGAALYTAGMHDEALTHLRRAIDSMEPGTEDPVLMSKITVCIGHTLYVRNDTEAAIGHYTRARELFGPVGDLDTLGAIYSGLSQAYEQKGDLTGALRYSKLSLSAFEAKQNARLAASELNNLAVRYQDLGNLEQARECAEESIERARRTNAPDVEALAHSTLAQIYLRRQDFQAAAREAELASTIAPDADGLAQVDAWTVQAELAERDGDHARADELFQRALDVLKRSDLQVRYADIALAYSHALRDRGSTEQALDLALRAAEARSTRSA